MDFHIPEQNSSNVTTSICTFILYAFINKSFRVTVYFCQQNNCLKTEIWYKKVAKILNLKNKLAADKKILQEKSLQYITMGESC